MQGVRGEAASEASGRTFSGERLAQAQRGDFATLLARGDRARARLIQEDMAEERPERLRLIREELSQETRPTYWEFTDRGVNFSYLPPEARACLDEFFAAFDLPDSPAMPTPTPTPQATPRPAGD